MPKNPIVQLLLFGAVVIWTLYELFGPGEAQSTAVIALEWFAVIGASLGIIGAIYQLATGKPLGARKAQP
jgi:ABC-type enterobactin transport system permease subunit